MVWNTILEHLHRYPGLDGKGLKKYEQECEFRWQNYGEQDGLACIALVFMIYYREAGALRALNTLPGKPFEQLVPFFDQATEALKMIQSIASLGTDTRIPSTIEQMVTDISALRPRVRNSLRNISKDAKEGVDPQRVEESAGFDISSQQYAIKASVSPLS